MAYLFLRCLCGQELLEALLFKEPVLSRDSPAVSRVKAPSPLITRWHGMTIAMRFAALAASLAAEVDEVQRRVFILSMQAQTLKEAVIMELSVALHERLADAIAELVKEL